jgi:hypothetical protein
VGAAEGAVALDALDHGRRVAPDAVLLEARRPVEAEAVYQDDLRRNPGNGWSLVGLTQALRAQQRLVEAQGMQGRFSLAWARADVSITRSRF